MLQLIFQNYNDIPLKESTILQLHNDMLKYSDKDQRHKGQYKFGPNRVEARDEKGRKVYTPQSAISECKKRLMSYKK